MPPDAVLANTLFGGGMNRSKEAEDVLLDNSLIVSAGLNPPDGRISPHITTL